LQSLPTSSSKGAGEEQVIQVLYCTKGTEDAEIIILNAAMSPSEHVFSV
jgi:hypothetical protein